MGTASARKRGDDDEGSSNRGALMALSPLAQGMLLHAPTVPYPLILMVFSPFPCPMLVTFKVTTTSEIENNIVR